MDDDDYPYEAKRRVTALIRSLEKLIAQDPEQEVDGIALPVVAAAINSIKAALPDDPVVASTVEIFSADFIGAGEPVRAASMLVVAEQLDAALGAYPIVIA